MNATQLLAHFDRLAEAPNAVPRLRRFILDLAVRGKLVEQDTGDEPAVELLKRIQAEKARLATLGLIKREKAAAAIETTAELPPPGWALCRWHSIAKKIGDIDHKMPDTVAGGVPYVSPRDFYPNNVINFEGAKLISRADYLRLAAKIKPDIDDLIYPRYGTIGENRLVTVQREFLASYSCAVVKTLTGFVDPKYQYIFSISGCCKDQAKAAENKNTQANVGIASIQQYIVALPPLSEQHRIVVKVDELMALCEQLEAAQQERERRRDRLAAASLQRLNQPAADATPEAQREHARFHLQHLPSLTTRPEHIKAMRQTILNLAVRGLLVSQDETNEPAATLLKEIQRDKLQLLRLGAIPKNKPIAGEASLTFSIPALWQAVRLGDVCNLITSGSRGWAEFYAQSGPKFLRAQNIRFGRLRLDDLACVNPPVKSEGARTQVQAGDLLIVITGAGVTNPALLERDLGEAYVSQHVALVRPSNVVLSQWLLLCLMGGPSGRDELVERAYGAGKPGLNLDNIRSLSMPIPPLAEQRRIVAKVDELMALCVQLEAQLTTTQTDSRRLLEAVLEAALTPA